MISQFPLSLLNFTKLLDVIELVSVSTVKLGGEDSRCHYNVVLAKFAGVVKKNVG